MNGLPISPPRASNFAVIHDRLFYTLLGMAAFFAIAVIGSMVYYAAKYRAGSTVKRDRPEHENMKVEAMLIGIPTLLSLVIFFWGAKVFAEERVPPSNAMEIFVLGKQWMWEFQHPNSLRENDILTVPVDTPIHLTMISQDVIHSLYFPAFRTQYQVLPGRYTSEWFTATQTGRFPLLCNLYCGMNHSKMNGYVQVLGRSEFEAWLAAGGGGYLQPSNSPEAKGAELFRLKSCDSCHGPQDSARGPSLVGIYGTERPLSDGSAVLAGDAYLRAAIVDPGAQIVRGYTNTMPNYHGTNEQDLWDLVAYVRSLSIGQASGSGSAK